MKPFNQTLNLVLVKSSSLEHSIASGGRQLFQTVTEGGLFLDKTEINLSNTKVTFVYRF